jgi:hypothetical protein
MEEPNREDLSVQEAELKIFANRRIQRGHDSSQADHGDFRKLQPCGGVGRRA